MKIVNLRMYQLQRLKELKIESGVFNSEAYMLVLNKKQAKSKNGIQIFRLSGRFKNNG